MQDPSDSREASYARLRLLSALFVAAPLIYFLSLGPAVVTHKSTNSAQVQSAIETIYYPLELFYESVPPVQPVIDSYMRLWD